MIPDHILLGRPRTRFRQENPKVLGKAKFPAEDLAYRRANLALL